jgi:prevent-host-death family protein
VTDVAITSARDELAELANRVAYAHARVVLTRRGRRIAALVPVGDLELLEMLEDRVDLAQARAALANARNRGERIGWEELKAELGL